MKPLHVVKLALLGMAVVASVVLAGLLFVHAQQLSVADVERIGGTGPYKVGKGYLVFHGLAVTDVDQGINSISVDRVVAVYRIHYNEDSGDRFISLRVINQGEFILDASGTVNFPDNTTYVYIIIDLPSNYLQGSEVIGLTETSG